MEEKYLLNRLIKREINHKNLIIKKEILKTTSIYYKTTNKEIFRKSIFEFFFRQNTGKVEWASNNIIEFDIGSFYSFINNTNPNKEFISGKVYFNEKESEVELKITFNYLKTFLASLEYLLVLLLFCTFLIVLSNAYPYSGDYYLLSIIFPYIYFNIFLFIVAQTIIKFFLMKKLIYGLDHLDDYYYSIHFSKIVLIPYYLIFSSLMIFIYLLGDIAAPAIGSFLFYLV